MTTNVSAPRHRAQRRAPLRSMAIITFTAAGATLLALGATGTTLAKWVDFAPVNAGIIAVGSLTLSIDTETEIELSGFGDMLPGDRVIQEVELETAGNVATDVTVGNSASAGVHEVRVANGACTTDPLAGDALGPAPKRIGEWSAGQSSTACIEVTLPSTAPNSAQGAATDFDLVFVATQKAD